MALEAGASSAHIGGAFSPLIVATLYSSFINYSENPEDPNRDRFILSKDMLVWFIIQF